MNPEDKFLKVEITAYFTIAGLNITMQNVAKDSEQMEYHLNGKQLIPDIVYN
jgi:hypothetical protein